MKPFISLCMIVKNEEKVLKRCLESVAHLVDEVIIVDTGSSDKTKEIASGYTSNILEFEWVNDFSQARNFAASNASGTWILVLDADEYVEEENFNLFIQELNESEPEYSAYAPRIINFAGQNGENIYHNHHPRIYLNNNNINYVRAIHEQLNTLNNEPLKIKKSCLTIFHSGYMNKTVTEKGKKVRNKDLLDIEMDKNKNEGFDYFNYGNEIYSQGDYEEALNYYLKAFEGRTDYYIEWVMMSMTQIVNCLIQLKRYTQALNVIKDAKLIYATAADFLYYESNVFYDRKQYDDAKVNLKIILKNQESYVNNITGPDIVTVLPNKMLGEIYYQEKNYSKAIYHFVSVLNNSKYENQTLTRVIEILLKFHTAEEISQFLKSNKLIDENNITNLITICFKLNGYEILEYILKDIDGEHRITRDLIKLKEVCSDELITEHVLEYEERWDLYIKTGLFSIIDLYLLNKKVINENVQLFFKELHKGNEYRAIANILDGKDVQNIDEELYLSALNITLATKKIDLATSLLNSAMKLEKKVMPKIGAILQTNNFTIEAMEYYQNSDWEDMTQQDFVNIIDNLLSIQEQDYAIQVSEYAKYKYPDDFRFLKILIENTEDVFKKEERIEAGLVSFPGSHWLKEELIKL